MARKKNLTRTGLPSFLSSALRTVRLKDLAEKRGKRLHILRKFIERILYPEKDVNDSEKSKLKIEDFAPQIDLKPGTWKRLEDAESCLSIEVAEWIAVQSLHKFGVFVTTEWLLSDNDCTDLPRIVNREPFDIYAYLKDIYKAEDLSKKLTDEQKSQMKILYYTLETENKLNNMENFKEIIGSYEKEILDKNERATIDSILKKNSEGPYKKEDCTFLKSVCRRFIVSADISTNEQATRSVLVGFFISDLFQKVSPESMVTYVRDNKMAPTFFKGEIVGGITISNQDIYKADKKECILQLANSVKIVRILHYISGNTVVANTISNENSPEIYALSEIKSIAIISFRYKNFERDGLNIDFGEERAPQLIEFADIINNK